jgi:hypothetical protein
LSVLMLPRGCKYTKTEPMWTLSPAILCIDKLDTKNFMQISSFSMKCKLK